MRKAQIIGLLIITVLLTFALALSSFALSPAPTAMAAPDAANEVHVDFFTGYIYEVPGDVFIDGEVTGKMDWHTRIVNIQDETGAVVKDLKVTLTKPDTGALIREWSYGDAPEEGSTSLPWTPDAVRFGDIKHHPCVFTPGFDASCSIDKTVFTAPDTQTVTITITPREERVIDNLYVEMVANEDWMVDPVIISHTSQQDVVLSPDKHIFGMHPENLELDTPWSIDLTLRITPNVTNNVTKLEYRPGIPIIYTGLPTPYKGVTEGSSVSFTNEAGEWTVSAEGDYVWNCRVGSPSAYTVAFDRIVNAEVERGPIVWIIVGIVAGIAIIGTVIYFFIRRQRRGVA